MAPFWYSATARLRHSWRSQCFGSTLSHTSRSIRTQFILKRKLRYPNSDLESRAPSRKTIVYVLLGGACVGISGFAALPYIRQYIDGPSYEYEALKNDDDIRVLTLELGEEDEPLRCRVKTVSLSSNPHYEALSYVWGDPTITKPILCSGKNIRVTTNLYDALQRFRLPDAERVLWVDAICINQSDLDEKNVQVPMMKDIYSKSSLVLIWLGRGSEHTDRALDALNQLHLFFLKHLKHYSADGKKYMAKQWLIATTGVGGNAMLDQKKTEQIRQFDWNSIEVFLSLPWFSRAWTLQEYVKSSKAILVCGSKSTTLEQLAPPLMEIHIQYVNTGRLYELGNHSDTIPEAIWSIIRMSLLQASDSVRGHSKPLLDLVKEHNNRACTNPRDKIYGFLGIATDLANGDWPLYPQYDLPVEEVYKQFACWCIQKTGNLDIFNSLRDYKVHSKVGPLPSWTPDWMDSGGRRDKDSISVTTYAGGKEINPQISVSLEDDSTLLVKGFVVDKIDRLALSYYQYTLWDDFRHLRFPEMLLSGADKLTRGKMVATFLSQNVAVNYLDGLVDAHKAVQKYSSKQSSSAALRDIVWVENCKDVASGGTGEMSEARFDVFWRTLASDSLFIVDGNRGRIQSPAPSSFKWTVKKHLKLLEDLRHGRRTLEYGMSPLPDGSRTIRASKTQNLPGTYLHEDEFKRWNDVVHTWVGNRRRRFCSTNNGNLGWAPDPAKEGDLICIFHGAKTPHVLRPCGDGKYKLIGVGYLHGMMHGEVLKLKQFKEEEFAIC